MCCRETDKDDADSKTVDHASLFGDTDAFGGIFVDMRDGDETHARECDTKTYAVEPAKAGSDFGLRFEHVGCCQVIKLGALAIGG